MEQNFCPECLQGKHQNCDEKAWDDASDSLVDCDCYLANHRLTPHEVLSQP